MVTGPYSAKCNVLQVQWCTRWECLVIQCNLVRMNVCAFHFTLTTPAMINLERVFTWRTWLTLWWVGVALTSPGWWA